MKSLYVFFALFFTVLTAYAVEKPVKVTGNIKGLGNNEVVLYTFENEEVARTKGVNDKFTLELTVDTDYGQPFFIHFPSIAPLEPSMKIPTMMLFIDSDHVEVTGYIDEKGIKKESIKGSPLSLAYEAVFTNLPVTKELNKAILVYNDAFHAYNEVSMTDENLTVLKKCNAKMDSLQEVRVHQLFASIPTDSRNKALAVVISSFAAYRELEEQEALLNQFDVSIRHCYGVEKMQRRIDLIKNCAVGAVAPDFELKDTSGKMIKLSSFRGKYVLVDFWASWCGPCRKALPLVKKANEEFKNKGLQVIGVSVDKKTKDWEKALEEEKLPYLQLHDPDGITGKLYNYDGIPFIILISPEGIILEKELWGDGIREAITKYIK
ncbi:TlpA disulfide reductase family protein [Butyricimonas faecalis]|jgi:peroxiredoxin